MRAPLLTAVLIIFILWLHYEIRSTTRKTHRDTENFWNKENEANSTRRKDISGLELNTLDTSFLPLEDSKDETINSYRDTILNFTDKKMLNISGISNTEIKNTYGAANLDTLSEYDNNFTQVVSILHKWAERLYSNGNTLEAQRVLEYAVSCKSDVTKSYRLLAEIYLKQNTPERINELIPIIEKLQIHEKDKLIYHLREMSLS